MATIDSKATLLPFQLFHARLPQYGHEPVFIPYWDWQNKEKGLIDPFLYEHAGRGDVGALVLISRFWDADNAPFRYGRGFMDNDYPGPQERQAIFNLVEAYEAEFNDFITNCYERALQAPQDPFRAICR
jgi:hypothetical protein